MSDLSESPEMNEKLRDALRNLPKIKAPWYFDARLQQRIRGNEKETPRGIFRPIPAFATLAVVLVCTGVVGYLTYLSPQEPGQLIDNQAVESSGNDVIANPPQLAPALLPSTESDGGSGPNAGGTGDVTVESGVVSVIEDSSQMKDSTVKVGVESTITGR